MLIRRKLLLLVLGAALTTVVLLLVLFWGAHTAGRIRTLRDGAHLRVRTALELAQATHELHVATLAPRGEGARDALARTGRALEQLSAALPPGNEHVVALRQALAALARAEPEVPAEQVEELHRRVDALTATVLADVDVAESASSAVTARTIGVAQLLAVLTGAAAAAV